MNQEKIQKFGEAVDGFVSTNDISRIVYDLDLSTLGSLDSLRRATVKLIKEKEKAGNGNQLTESATDEDDDDDIHFSKEENDSMFKSLNSIKSLLRQIEKVQESYTK